MKILQDYVLRGAWPSTPGLHKPGFHASQRPHDPTSALAATLGS